MRSNIACTCGSESVPLRAPPAEEVEFTARLLERAEVVDQLVELLRIALLEARVRRHRRGRVHERARDGLAREAAGDVRQLRARPGVAVLADAVAAQAARRRHHVLAALVLGRGGQ